MSGRAAERVTPGAASRSRDEPAAACTGPLDSGRPRPFRPCRPTKLGTAVRFAELDDAGRSPKLRRLFALAIAKRGASDPAGRGPAAAAGARRLPVRANANKGASLPGGISGIDDLRGAASMPPATAAPWLSCRCDSPRGSWPPCRAAACVASAGDLDTAELVPLRRLYTTGRCAAPPSGIAGPVWGTA